jgi:DNA processing protein
VDHLLAHTSLDPSFPKRLRAMPEATPTFLEASGPLARALDAPLARVAIVGTRRCSDYGMRYARWLATILAQRGVTIVSGGAYGIDSAAHLGALDVGGKTIAVLPAGIDDDPGDRAPLLSMIERTGAIVALQPRGTARTRETIFLRNSVIAALAEDVVIVEAPLQSGARNTAKHARDLGRRLWVVTSSCGWRHEGNLQELDWGARPLFVPRRLFEAIGLEYRDVVELAKYVEPDLPPWLAPPRDASASNPLLVSTTSPPALVNIAPSIAATADEQRVVEALQKGALSIDELVLETAFEVGTLRALLLTWTVDGVVREGPGGRFRLVTH